MGNKVQNDLTWNLVKVVVLTGPRTGGTFLAHCLSNHPDVYCERQEVMHTNSSYRRGSAVLTPVQILDIIFGQSGYIAAACKLQYSQAGYSGIWEYLKEKEARIIQLVRANKLRQIISVIINRKVRAGEIPLHPQHSWKSTQRPSVEIAPDEILAEMGKVAGEEQRWTERIKISGLRSIRLTYTEMIGADTIEAREMTPSAAARVCRFLGVRTMPLHCELKRINPWPLSEIVSNWEHLQAMLPSAYQMLLKSDAEKTG